MGVLEGALGAESPTLPPLSDSRRPGLAGRDAPSRGSRGRGGGAGLRAPAPPSITWPESHKNNSFGQDRDFRKGAQGPRRQPPPHGGQFSGIVREAEPPAAAAAAASSAAARAGAASAPPQLSKAPLPPARPPGLGENHAGQVMRAAWRPRAPLPRAAPRAAPALAPRARELCRAPAREDGPRHCALRKPQTPPALPRRARPGAPGQPSSPPAPGRGGPRGLLFGKTWRRLQRNPAPRPLERRQPPRRPQALSPERDRGVRVGGPRGTGRGPGAALRAGGSAQPASALAAAKAHRCSGEGRAGGATTDRH